MTESLEIPVDWDIQFPDELIKSLIASITKVGAHGFIHGWICVRPPCGAGTRVKLDPSTNAVLRRGTNHEMIGHVTTSQHGGWTFHHLKTGKLSKSVGATAEEAVQRLAEYHNAHLMAEHTSDKPTISSRFKQAATAIRNGNREQAVGHLTKAHELLATDWSGEPGEKAQLVEHAGMLSNATFAPKEAVTAIKPKTDLAGAIPGSKVPDNASSARLAFAFHQQKVYTDEQAKLLQKKIAEDRKKMDEFSDDEEGKKSKLKFALHVLFIAAGAALAWGMTKLDGLPEYVGVVGGTIPLVAQELIDCIKRL